jgi:hypothetical protein
VAGPIAFSFLMGILLFLLDQVLPWFKSGTWTEKTIQNLRVVGRPIFSETTGWFGIDRILQWLDTVPLVAWFLLIFPIVWFLIWTPVLNLIAELVDKLFGLSRHNKS